MWVIIFFSLICFYLLVNAYKIQKKIKKSYILHWFFLKNDFLVRENQKCPKKTLKRAPLAISPKIVFKFVLLITNLKKIFYLYLKKIPKM